MFTQKKSPDSQPHVLVHEVLEEQGRLQLRHPVSHRRVIPRVERQPGESCARQRLQAAALARLVVEVVGVLEQLHVVHVVAVVRGSVVAPAPVFLQRLKFFVCWKNELFY